MLWLSHSQPRVNKTPCKNKVLSAIKKVKQTNPNVSYIIHPHSRLRLKEKHITHREVVKSIEEFDNIYEHENKSVVEKRMWGQILRTVFSMGMDSKVHIISSMHISERQFNTVHKDTY